MSEFLTIVTVGTIVCTIVLLWVRYEGKVADWLDRTDDQDGNAL